MTKEEFQKERTKIISELVEGLSEEIDGIYPTSKCYEELDKLYDRIIKEGGK